MNLLLDSIPQPTDGLTPNTWTKARNLLLRPVDGLTPNAWLQWASGQESKYCSNSIYQPVDGLTQMPGLRPGKSTAQTLYTNLFIGLHQMPGLRPEIYCLASIYQHFDGQTPNSWMRGCDLLIRYFLNLIFFCCAH